MAREDEMSRNNAKKMAAGSHLPMVPSDLLPNSSHIKCVSPVALLHYD